MNLNRPAMTEAVKSEDYTKNILKRKWSLKPMPSGLRLTA